VSTLIEMPDTCAANVTLALRRVVSRSTSPFTLETQSFQWPGEQWEIEFDFPTFTSRATASQWIAFAAKMRGSYNYFLLGDPSAKEPRGVATGTPTVAAANQVGNQLQTKDWTPNVTGILLAGDYIQYGTGVNARLHMVVEDVNSDAGGLATLSLEPALRYSPALNAPIVTSNARGVFRLADNTYSWSVAPGPQYRLGFSALEVINA
jgi:hypothetical protein